MIMYEVGFVFSFFFCKQKTAYDMRSRDWSSDVCSSDLDQVGAAVEHTAVPVEHGAGLETEVPVVSGKRLELVLDVARLRTVLVRGTRVEGDPVAQIGRASCWGGGCQCG